jgi:RNA polymerase sigma-70 factor (ECF subfamily)
VERTDTELVRLARQGDRGAFQELVERHQRKVYAVLLGMLHDHDAAWETSQETFIEALRGLDRFKGEATFSTWLYRIAVNVAIDYQRHERQRPLVGVAATTVEAESREIGERVRAAIAQLTPEHRAAILLREVEGLSYEEISRVMECAKGTVMSRLHYARKKLQAQLQDSLAPRVRE